MTIRSSIKYAPIPIDEDWGSVVPITLNRVGLISKYSLAVVLGTLEGGTSPAYTVSGSNPAVTHINVEADNDTLYDADTDMIQELNKLSFGYVATGQNFRIDMADIDMIKKRHVAGTEFPSYLYNTNTLRVTLPPLSTITSGSPTGTSGSQLLLVEDQLNYPQSVPLSKVKKLQSSFNLSATGDNILNPSPTFTVDGSYKVVLYQTKVGGSLTDSAVDYISLTLNTSSVLEDDYWTTLKQTDYEELHEKPDTGYAMRVYMAGGSEPKDASELLYLLNSQQVRSVVQNFHVTSGTTTPVAVKTMKIEYMV